MSAGVGRVRLRRSSREVERRWWYCEVRCGLGSGGAGCSSGGSSGVGGGGCSAGPVVVSAGVVAVFSEAGAPGWLVSVASSGAVVGGAAAGGYRCSVWATAVPTSPWSASSFSLLFFS